MAGEYQLQCGPFELTELVGLGGMSAVFRGVHSRDGMEVALKVMTQDLARREKYQKAFRREVQALASLHHPSIATIIDYGTIQAEVAGAGPDSVVEGAPWFAMEYVEGIDLSEYGSIETWETVETILFELLDALAHAHASGILHRDLKPSNILMTEGGNENPRVKLVDFGIARISDRSEEGERSVRGTPQYMAPEQILARWRDQGPWTDLYALGCTTWKIVSGAWPFDGEKTEDVLQSQLHKPPPRFNPTVAVPAALQEWVDRLLMKEPERRFRRAADAAYALMRVCRVSDMVESEAEHDGGSEDPKTTHRPTLAAIEKTLVGTSSVGNPVADFPTEEEGLTPMHREPSVSPEPPPIPSAWRRATDDSVAGPAHGAGLELFSLRKIPFVDRDAERDRLWEYLQAVDRTGEPTAVLLEGPVGCGKSRLAEWLTRRAHELGAVEVLRATHSEAGGPRDGIGPMLSRHFQCDGLSWSETFARMRDVYSSLGFSGEAAFHDAMGVAHLMGGDGEGGRPSSAGFYAPRERNLALRRLFRRMAETRTLLIWLDDIQWGWDAASLTQFLIEEDGEGDLPVYLVITAHTEYLDGRKPVAEIMERACGSRRGERLEIGELPDPEQRRLVETMLKFDPNLVEDIVARTEGNPLFASQLVGAWVEGEALELADTGFVLPEGRATEVPRDIFDLWRQRLERVVTETGSDAVDDERRALELAAALGRHVDQREWEELRRRARVRASESLVAALARQGLARTEERGWSFIHGMLVETLQAMAEEAGRWGRWQKLCAETLRALDTGENPEMSRRRARHLYEAGDRAGAAEQMLESAERAMVFGDFKQVAHLLDRYQGLLDDLGVASRSVERARGWRLRAQLHYSTGELEEVERLVGEIESAGKRSNSPVVLGESYHLRGVLLRSRGDVDGALRFFDRAQKEFAQSASPKGVARSFQGQGVIARMQGNLEDAREHFHRALQAHSNLGQFSKVADMERKIGATWLEEGELGEAGEAFERGLELARKVGARRIEAYCWNAKGELARHREEWEQARECYERAAELHALAGSRQQHLARFNIVCVEIADRRFRIATRLLDGVERALDDEGYRFVRPSVALARACCAAAREDWDAWEEQLNEAVQISDQMSRTVVEESWLAELAGRIARRHGAGERAERALELARSF